MEELTVERVMETFRSVHVPEMGLGTSGPENYGATFSIS